MTDAELRKAEARYRRASARAETARGERNRLVLDALEDGWTHARIAGVLGVTRGRVNQLAKAARG